MAVDESVMASPECPPVSIIEAEYFIVQLKPGKTPGTPSREAEKK